RTDAHRVGRPLGMEFPRQLRRDIGIEADRNRVAEHFGLLRGSDGIVALRRPAEAGDAAEKIIKRHRGKTQSDHCGRKQGCKARGTHILRADRVTVHQRTIRAMVMRKKSSARPPRIHAIKLARLRWRRRYSASSKGSGVGSSVIVPTYGRS